MFESADFRFPNNSRHQSAACFLIKKKKNNILNIVTPRVLRKSLLFQKLKPFVGVHKHTYTNKQYARFEKIYFKKLLRCVRAACFISTCTQYCVCV